MADKDVIKEFIARRGLAKGCITRMVTFADKITERTSDSDISSRLELLERAFTDFIECETMLSKYEVPSEMAEIETKYLSVKAKFVDSVVAPQQRKQTSQIESVMARLLKEQNEFLSNVSSSFTSSLNQTIHNTTEEPHSYIRLPNLNLPKFSGKYENFPSFKDLYVASVHNKLGFSDAQKFQYLKTLLEGEAADLVKHIPVSEANYTQAWTKICERYDKRKYVLNSMIKSFLELPTMQDGSVKKLRNLCNVSNDVHRGIQALGGEATGRDPWLTYMLIQKMDPGTKEAWAHKTVNQDYPTFDEFLKFLCDRCDALESCESGKHTTSKPSTAKSHQLKLTDTNVVQCVFCKESHRLYECDKFKGLEINRRREQAAKLRICFNCLSTRHKASQCTSTRSCFKCNRRHHSLLHDNTITNSAVISAETPTIPVEQTKANTSVANTSITNTCSAGTTILPTAIINVKDQFDQIKKCRVLLDSGSQTSFISQPCVKRLGLKRDAGQIRVEGLATSNVSTIGSAKLTLYSQFDMSQCLKVKVYIVPKITTLPANDKITSIQIPQHSKLQLADSTPSRKQIDILLGADYFFYILRSKRIQLANNIFAHETMFGYVLAGGSQEDSKATILPAKMFNVMIRDEQYLEEILRKFWEQEEVCNDDLWTQEEQACEENFKSTCTKNKEGRYIVQLPMKEDCPPLGQSYSVALQRIFAMEKKFNRQPEFEQLYKKFMEEYIQLGHMKRLSDNEIYNSNHETYYLPHHGVLKENSSTTKLRVVFDGSAATSTGISLNDKLMVGPTLQDTLWAIILRFRSFKVAICADIEKMYRQILVDSNQTSLQRILWRNSPTEPISQYELLTVTYGTSCAPFLAIRVLFQIADECKSQYPELCEIIKRNFYVDDLLTGADDEQQAAKLKQKLSDVLAQRGFHLRKWRSNIKTLNDVHELTQLIEDGNVSQMLGLYWSQTSDYLMIKILEMPYGLCTKRNVLSIASKIFDPLGLLLPFTVKIKIFLQSLWLRKVTWDEPLDADLKETWSRMYEQFKFLGNVKVPRFSGSVSSDIQLHGFSDSSEVAYSAVVYVRVKDNDRWVVNLLTAKGKVAPISQVSLPRLELCGAHLLAKLLSKVLNTYQLTNIPIWTWTDSMVVLSWLSNHPRKWKPFVANRVAAIHKLLPQTIWHHVKGKENPADLATRGLMADKVASNELWFKGPHWLSLTEEMWPTKSTIIQTLQERRIKKLQVLQTQVTTEENHPISCLLARFSNWDQLTRSMAFVLRFVNNIRSKDKLLRNLCISEIEAAELRILKYVQYIEFDSEIKLLVRKKGLPSNSRIISLTPFVDSNNLLRVGGRLQNSQCSYNMKHPIILPRNHQITTMILQHLHKKYLHPGPSLLTALSRHKYWILGVREKCRKICHSCVKCFRYSTLRSIQQMGSLPQARVTPSRPFATVGIDYAGPILLSTKKGRGAKLVKGFLVIFVCFATKAIHIEVASDLTTDAFLAALDRFVSRRGAPTQIYSDNGSNFLGAKRKLHEHYNMLASKECQYKVNEFALHKRIEWHLIPPISPHFGGVWERAVRSVKAHLIKTVGNAHLTYEEMQTTTTQIEGILNSRPLCAIQNEDVCNIDTLTPAHFLTLGPVTYLPHSNLEEINMSRLTRWEQVQRLVQNFWRKYSITYLHTLQQRTKWRQKGRSLQIDDVVLMHDNNSPPSTWPLGRVIDLHAGADGLVRVATVQSKSSTYKRPITKLYRLPIDD